MVICIDSRRSSRMLKGSPCLELCFPFQVSREFPRQGLPSDMREYIPSRTGSVTFRVKIPKKNYLRKGLAAHRGRGPVSKRGKNKKDRRLWREVPLLHDLPDGKGAWGTRLTWHNTLTYYVWGEEWGVSDPPEKGVPDLVLCCP